MVVGTLLVQNSDYMQTVSAVDINANGQQIYISYVTADGNLRATSTSLVIGPDGIPSAMSGCTIV